MNHTFDAEIAAYYQRNPETGRLENGPFLLEALRTRELFSRFAPPPPAVVLDIGGGTGAYSFWLAEKGYSVHLVDPVDVQIVEAERANSASSLPLVSCQVGDARKLNFKDAAADVLLLLGPLYHLTDAADRLLALSEAARVLKPGGLLFAAAISRYASVLDGVARELLADPEFVQIANQDLRSGQHRNPTGKPDYFTTAYFHRPEDLHDEVAAAGLDVKGVFGIEGPGWILPDIAARLADPIRREILLNSARMLDDHPGLTAASAHILAVARKPI